MFIPREEPFTCEKCGLAVQPFGKGSYRNHCPRCLHSKHVDESGPGDRLSTCKGLMEPVEIDQDGKKGFTVVHRCVRCKKISRNRAADDDDLVGFLKRNTKIA